MEDINKRIDDKLAKDLKALEATQEPVEDQEQAKPIDYYQAMRNDAYEASQSPTVHGSPAQLPIIVDKMVEDFKQTDYNVNRNQYDHLREYEANDEAERLRQNYLVTEFLPLVESVVEIYGPSALLNSQKALDKLDEVALTPNGSGHGFTEGYLMQMHKGQTPRGSRSDIEVSYGLAKAQDMANDGDIRGGIGLAKNLVERINRGELSASEEDYETLLRGASAK